MPNDGGQTRAHVRLRPGAGQVLGVKRVRRFDSCRGHFIPRGVRPGRRATELPVRKGGVRLARRRRVLLDTGAVPKRDLVARIEDRAAAGPRADHQDHARFVARADERVRRVRRAVEEVPRAQAPFLSFDDQEALAPQDEEILLIRLTVVERARLARLEDVQLEAELRVVSDLELWSFVGDAPVGLETTPRAEDVVQHPCRLAGVEHEPAIALRDEPGTGVGEACFLHASVPAGHFARFRRPCRSRERSRRRSPRAEGGHAASGCAAPAAPARSSRRGTRSSPTGLRSRAQSQSPSRPRRGAGPRALRARSRAAPSAPASGARPSPRALREVSYGRRGDHAADSRPAPISRPAAAIRNPYVISDLPGLRPRRDPRLEYAARSDFESRASKNWPPV